MFGERNNPKSKLRDVAIQWTKVTKQNNTHQNVLQDYNKFKITDVEALNKMPPNFSKKMHKTT